MIRASIFTTTSRPAVLVGKFVVPVWGPCPTLIAMLNGVVRFALNRGQALPRGVA